MHHRHYKPSSLSLAAIDDVICRGGWQDWIDLRGRVLTSNDMLARVQRPVRILGSLDGIETGVPQLIREQPLETMVFEHAGEKLTVPTAPRFCASRQG